MLRLTSKLDSGPTTTKRQLSTTKSKYFVSSKNLFTKPQATQTRPASRGRLGIGSREFDLSKGFNSTSRVHGDIDGSNTDKIAISLDKLKSTKIGSLGSTKKLNLNGYLKRASETPKVSTAAPMVIDKAPILSSTKLHRKMPSLYIKKDYSTVPIGSLHISRNGSIERGVANLSKDSVGSKTNLVKKNNFIDKPPSQKGSADKRPNSKTGSRLAKQLIITSTELKQRESKKDLGVVSMNSSVDRLKSTFLFQKLSSELAGGRDDKDNKKTGSSTRYTQDPETVIAWRDDIQLDVEKELTFTGCVGQGSFAKVYEGFDKRLKQAVAIKVIDKRKIHESKRRQLIQTEVNILARMKHRHISEFHRLVEDHKRLFIVMQMCGTNTLNVFCRKFPDKRLNEEQAHALFIQIAKGVKYMHDHNVAHRDLKLTNMLIDHEYVVKIIDFGFACEAEEMHKMYCGTPSYMAPEIVEKKVYAPRPTDIWSLGVVLFKLLTGDYAFGAEDHPSLKKNIVNVEVNYPEFFGTKVKNLLEKCFEYDPQKRITIGEMLQHPWLMKFKELI